MSKFFAQSLWLYAIAIIGLTLSLLAFYPGFMEYDSFVQYGQASGKLPLDDWHPISMTLLWKVLISIYDGPQLMLLLQAVLYWSGFLYLSWHLLHDTSRFYLAISAVIVPFFPFLINFSGVIWKDTHLAISLFCACLLLSLGKPSRKKLLLSIIFIFYAISVRHNGLAAALPILVLWSYQYIRLTNIKNQYIIPLITVSLVLIYLFLPIGFSHFIAFEKTSPLKAQLLNEIVFIKCQSNSHDFNNIQTYYGDKLKKIEPKKRQKLLCNQISSLATKDDTNIVYDQEILEEPDYNDQKIMALWIDNVKSHPFLYLQYRFLIYKTFLRPFSYSQTYNVFIDGMEEENLPVKLSIEVLNPFELTFFLRDYVTFSAEYFNLFFRPLFWLITLALTTLLSIQKRNYIAFLVSLSGLLYLMLYFLFLPAPDFRYAYYSIFAQILTIFIFLKQKFSLSCK